MTFMEIVSLLGNIHEMQIIFSKKKKNQKIISEYQGPVAQSVVTQILTAVVSTVSNSQVFLLKKCE